MEKIKGTIEEAKILKIYDMWKKKPKGLGFSDTEAVVVTVKAGGRLLKETFYCCIKADGTISTKVSDKGVGRQRKLTNFIKKYITKNVEDYDIKQGIKNWKGKKVDVLKDKDITFVSCVM